MDMRRGLQLGRLRETKTSPAERQEITRRWLEGARVVVLAHDFKLSPARIEQIVRKVATKEQTEARKSLVASRNARKKRERAEYKAFLPHGQPESRASRERLASMPKPQWRSDTAKMCGEPAVGRSALERKKDDLLALLVGDAE